MKPWSIILLWFVLAGCSSTTSCDSKYILLKENDFSISVSTDPVMSPLPDSPRNSAAWQFYIEHNGQVEPAMQIVEKYNFKNHASKEFEFEKELAFRSNEEEGTWKPIEGIETLNLSASRFFAACGFVQPFPNETCRFIAQYNRYVIYFATEITENGMSQEMFLKAITKIDSKVSVCSSE